MENTPTRKWNRLRPSDATVCKSLRAPPCAAVSESSDADPSAQERALLRYYYYIHNGIETGQVAPMADQWLMHMDSMLAAKLRVRAE